MRCMRQQTHDCETCYLSSPECGGATNVPDPEQNAYICLPALCTYELSRITAASVSVAASTAVIPVSAAVCAAVCAAASAAASAAAVRQRRMHIYACLRSAYMS